MKRIYKAVLIFIWCVSINSCKEDYVIKNICREYRTIDSIRFDEISTGHHLFKPEQLITVNDRLICYDEKTDRHIFHMYSIPECQHISSFGTIGNGPKEFQQINKRIFGNYNQEIYLIDGMKLKCISLPDSSKKFNLSKKINLSGRLLPLSALTLINDSLLFGCSSSNETEYFLYNSNHLIDKDIGGYKNILGINPLRLAGYKTINSQRIAIRPDNKKIVALYAMLPYIKVFDSNLNLENEAILSDFKSQSFDVTRNGDVRLSPTTKVYYLDVATNNNYIYGLFIGKHRSYLGQNGSQKGGIIPKLHIWNWECQLVAEINLRKSISNIAIDQTGRYLLGISPYDSDKIYRYDLSSVFNKNNNEDNI
jgi:hypothetical protein